MSHSERLEASPPAPLGPPVLAPVGWLLLMHTGAGLRSLRLPSLRALGVTCVARRALPPSRGPLSKHLRSQPRVERLLPSCPASPARTGFTEVKADRRGRLRAAVRQREQETQLGKGNFQVDPLCTPRCWRKTSGFAELLQGRTQGRWFPKGRAGKHSESPASEPRAVPGRNLSVEISQMVCDFGQ